MALLLGSLPARAGGKNAVLVIDANTGNTLYSSAADELRYPASLTKMMTLYMVFDLIERGRLSYQTQIRISAAAAAAAPSKLDLKEGDTIALIDAIRVLITKSANDVATAVAEHIGGTEEKFARMMTHKAHQIGMAQTTFRNASGLPDPQQMTTARDMATLALRLQDEFPQHYVLFGTRTFVYRGETFNNHNTLLFHYEGTDGIKTGYTRASGFNLVSSVRRGRKHVVGVVFGGASASSRNTAMRTFLNIGLVRASSEKTRKTIAPLIAKSPAGEPKLATVPTPQRVAARPVEPPAAATPPGNGIAVLRVRPVPMPPRKDAPAETASIDGLLRAASERPALPVAAPSTLDQQAARIARPEPVAAPWTTELRPGSRTADTKATMKMPAPAKPNAAPQAIVSGRFHVQIGAFPSAAEAERQLAAVRARAPASLALAKPFTQPVQQGDKTLYRARYAGLESATATEACEELKKQGVACLVFKSD